MSNVKFKNVKISEIHHEKLKKYCNDRGIKIYKILEKWIDENCNQKKKDIYGD